MDKEKTPLPGRRVRGSRSGRPIMAAFDLLGRRWSLRVLWELREPAVTFRDLQDKCGGLSPTLLNRRLAELRDAGLVASRDPAGYELTAAGKSLLRALAPLARWADGWASRAKQAPESAARARRAK